MSTKNDDPFTVKGKNVITPKGKALWCKFKEPDYKFNSKGVLSTDLVLDPTLPEVQKFIGDLEELRDQALAETVDSLGPKGKQVKAKDVFKLEYTQDGEETGNVVFKLNLKDVDTKKAKGKQHTIKVVDAKNKKVPNPPLVGNGSTIRCSAFAKPFFMGTTKEIGITLYWNGMQIIELVSYGDTEGFDEEEGFSVEDVTSTPANPFLDETGDDDSDF